MLIFVAPGIMVPKTRKKKIKETKEKKKKEPIYINKKK
jgi:hypothetical protein